MKPLIFENFEDKISSERCKEMLDAWAKLKVSEEEVPLPTTNKKTKEREDAVMLTINPRNDVTIGQLMKRVNSFAGNKTTYPYLYAWAFEQRSKTERDFHGFHVHMLFYGQRPSHVLRHARSAFNKLVGDPKHQNYTKWINVKTVNYDDTLMYLEGIKKGKPKVTHSSDLIWREENMIDNIYLPDAESTDD